MNSHRYRLGVLKVKIAEKLASQASRGQQNWFNRLCSRVLEKLMKIELSEQYMSDDICDANVGYDPDELESYQRGEIKDTKSAGV